MTEGAIGERLLAHAGKLRLLCLHLSGAALRRRVELEDLVQETFLRALADPAAIPAEDSQLARWLAGLARHVVIDAARAARAQKRSGGEQRLALSDWSRSGAVAARSAGPATRAAGRELEERLERAFRELPAEQRRVIGLRQLEGLSAAEAARRMGRSETAVHSLYRRALLGWEAAAR